MGKHVIGEGILLINSLAFITFGHYNFFLLGMLVWFGRLIAHNNYSKESMGVTSTGGVNPSKAKSKQSDVL